MRAGYALLTALILSGCATAPIEMPNLTVWTASKSSDEFSDQVKCRVEPTTAIVNSGSAVGMIQYYPLVERRGDSLRVGVTSGRATPAPAGRVEMRVDSNDAVTIDTSETPIDVSSGAISSVQPPANFTPEMKATWRASMRSTAKAIDQATSPYTVATGDKAHEILNEMKAGQTLIYRQAGSNGQGSSTGRIALGADFNRALTVCGL